MDAAGAIGLAGAPAGVFNSTYYATIAQVIPILFVLVFVELGIIRRGELQLGRRGAPFLLVVFVLLLGAEAMCLHLLDIQRQATNLEAGVIAGGLIWPTGVALVYFLTPIAGAISQHWFGHLVLRIYFLGTLTMLGLLTVGVVDFTTLIASVVLTGAAGAVALPLIAGTFGSLRRRWRDRACDTNRDHGDGRVWPLRHTLVAIVIVLLAARRHGR